MLCWTHKQRFIDQQTVPGWDIQGLYGNGLHSNESEQDKEDATTYFINEAWLPLRFANVEKYSQSNIK